jgi:lipopolysaccharide export system ATP-binding protein
MAEFSITHLSKVKSTSLSGGERRRLEIARALAANPKFMFLDEPLAGIDPLAINDIKQLIKQLVKKGVSVLITDHNVRDTLNIVDKAYVMSDGLIVTQGTPQQIVKDKKARDVYLGDGFRLDENS